VGGTVPFVAFSGSRVFIEDYPLASLRTTRMLLNNTTPATDEGYYKCGYGAITSLARKLIKHEDRRITLFSGPHV
jgi:hypothetical protein